MSLKTLVFPEERRQHLTTTSFADVTTNIFVETWQDSTQGSRPTQEDSKSTWMNLTHVNKHLRTLIHPISL